MNFFKMRTFHNEDNKPLHVIETIVFIGLVFSMATASIRRTVAASNEIRSETLRLHIIANSDSNFDQELKLKVRDRVLEYTGELFAEVSGKSEAKALAEYTTDKIKSIAEAVLNENGVDYPVSVEVTKMWFETRSYDGFTLPAGDYDAVRIILGNGEGHNWWCVMYPQLCISGAENAFEKYGDNSYFVIGEGYEVRFAIVELFEKIKKSI